ncbi:MAG: pilus assembly protein PilM [Planctomycetota bacterium]
MAGRNAIAIDIGRRGLRALVASRNRDRLRVARVLVEPLPDDLADEEAKVVGAWAGRQLADAGFPRTKATIAISREHVALKRITLPTTQERELPEMTRLAVQRDLPFDARSAVIDFVCVDRTASSTTVLAVAIPQAVLSFARQAARGAGLRVERISLRNMGSAALVNSLADPDKGGTLAVDITGERVEFTVVSNGVIRFSRAAELPALDDPRGLADAVITETRRTWMSYRIVDDANDVRRAVVIGDRRVSEETAGSIGDILNVRTEVLNDHPFVDAGGQEMDGAWPLAGLLLEPSLDVASVDFVRPRKAPDIAGRKRQLALAIVGLLAVLLVGGWTVARSHLASMRQTAAQLEAQRGTLRPQFARYGRDLYKLEHLQQWESVDADWLDHLAYIAALAPPSDRLVLDAWAGSLTFGGVKFDRQSRRFGAPRQIKIVLEGEAADRATADSFRGALVDLDAYQISTTGPDTKSGRRLSYSFSYHLRTTAGAPPDRKPPEPTPAVGDRASVEAGLRRGPEEGTE